MTCKWWDQIWLNEGMATLFEYLLVDNVYPDIKTQEFFNVNKLQLALKVDALEKTHPMTFDGETLYEIVYYKCEFNLSHR